MPKLRIDHREVEVPPGATVLDAARRLGIDIPTLCFRDGCDAAASCLVCIVKIVGQRRLVPACATAAAEGMEVESETEEVRQVRRAALELLLSDHVGDCLAPCWFACPAHLDIPAMLRRVAAGRMPEAIAIIERELALPGVLGRICPAPCEKACRRSGLDGGVMIRAIERRAAEAALSDSVLPPCEASSGKCVAIVGAGPTGLAVAKFLAQQGHACTLLDEADQPGGRLRSYSEQELPRDVIDGEIARILRLGVEFRPRTRLGRDATLKELRGRFDAVLIAWGATEVGKDALPASIEGVFAAGGAVRGKGLVVRSVADGKEAAAAIGRFLAGTPLVGRSQPFSTKIGRMDRGELVLLSAGAGEGQRLDAASLDADQAVAQAARCMHCDCRRLATCKLRRYAALYGADPRRFDAARRPFAKDVQHADVVFESGKCIDCGLCVQIAAAAGEPLGLTFIGRGFDVRIAAPFGASLAEALQKAAAACVVACPTGALAMKKSPLPPEES